MWTHHRKKKKKLKPSALSRRRATAEGMGALSGDQNGDDFILRARLGLLGLELKWQGDQGRSESRPWPRPAAAPVEAWWQRGWKARGRGDRRHWEQGLTGCMPEW